MEMLLTVSALLGAVSSCWPTRVYSHYTGVLLSSCSIDLPKFMNVLLDMFADAKNNTADKLRQMFMYEDMRPPHQLRNGDRFQNMMHHV